MLNRRFYIFGGEKAEVGKIGKAFECNFWGNFSESFLCGFELCNELQQ